MKTLLELAAMPDCHPAVYAAAKAVQRGQMDETAALRAAVLVLVEENKGLKQIAEEALRNSPYPPIVIPGRPTR